jgi:hypothetical protein
MDNQITVNDIVQFKNIIEICSKRGAFQASEMEVVGGLYNRVKSFTDEVEAKAREQKSENENAPLESVPEEQEHQEPSDGGSEDGSQNVSLNVEETN